jgi:hypothetical protein
MPSADVFVDPSQIPGLYETGGLYGAIRDKHERIAMQLSTPSFWEAYPGLVGFSGRVDSVFNYRAALAYDSEFGAYEAQTTGDCVSHSTRNAGYINYCVRCSAGHETYDARFATENIYGFRGHGGQGASCDLLARYVGNSGPGGFLFRRRYDPVDLSKYDSRVGHNWGRGGTPREVNQLADDNKAGLVYTISSVDEALDAIASGFGISRCSWMGFSSKRNDDGVAERTTRWSHAEAWTGYWGDERIVRTYGGPVVTEQNSWGPWNGGPRPNDMPEGSYNLKPEIYSRMISEGGVYAIGSVDVTEEAILDTSM